MKKFRQLDGQLPFSTTSKSWVPSFEICDQLSGNLWKIPYDSGNLQILKEGIENEI